MVYYPMGNRRLIEENVRLLQAMLTNDAHKIAMPERWLPGCDVIVLAAPKSGAVAASRVPSRTA